jgi:hypothetical protein
MLSFGIKNSTAVEKVIFSIEVKNKSTRERKEIFYE